MRIEDKKMSCRTSTLEKANLSLSDYQYDKMCLPDFRYNHFQVPDKFG